MLPNLPATPPVEYHIEAVIYDAATQERLVLQEESGRGLAHSYTIGHLRIAKSPAIAVVEPARSVSEGVISSEVRLLGIDLRRNLVNPGDDLEVALYWEALQDVSGDYLVVVQLSDAQGRVWAQEQSRPVYGDYPTTDWEKGKVIRAWREAVVDRQTPSASYQLAGGLSGGRQPVGQLDLGTVGVSGRSRSYEVPTMDHRLDLRLGDGALLLGYDLEDIVEAGQPIQLTLYWQCLAETTTSYIVFTHVVDDAASMERVPRCDAQGALRGDTMLLKSVNVAL